MHATISDSSVTQSARFTQVLIVKKKMDSKGVRTIEVRRPVVVTKSPIAKCALDEISWPSIVKRVVLLEKTVEGERCLRKMLEAHIQDLHGRLRDLGVIVAKLDYLAHEPIYPCDESSTCGSVDLYATHPMYNPEETR